MDNTTLFKVVEWPLSQELMELDEFNQHVMLINDQPLLQEYGPQAYLVRVSWYNEVLNKINT